MGGLQDRSIDARNTSLIRRLMVWRAVYRGFWRGADERTRSGCSQPGTIIGCGNVCTWMSATQINFSYDTGSGSRIRGPIPPGPLATAFTPALISLSLAQWLNRLDG